MTKPKLPINGKPSPSQIAEYVRTPVEELSKQQMAAMRDKIEKLMRTLDEYGLNYKTLYMLDKDKKAYPNYDQYMYIPGQHDMQKWMQAVRQIYAGEKNGMSRIDVIRQSTNGWNLMETFDFLNWLRFYQEGTHLKYKTAQLWYENGQPGYFLQIKPDPKPEESKIDSNTVEDTKIDVEYQEEKKKTIEKQRQKIIGRLDSAEKLLRSPEGQMFAGDELENLMEAIYSLKKKVQLVNKLSTATKLYEDMIVREANVLHRRGFVKAAAMLYSVAQANNPPPPGTGIPGNINTPPTTPSPPDPSGAGQSGVPGGLPSYGPGMPQPPGSPPTGPSETQPVDPKSPNKPNGSTISDGPVSVTQSLPEGLEQFLEQTETAGKTVPDDKQGVDDNLDIEDTLEVDDLEEPLMVSEAQMAPPVEEDIPLTTTPSKPKPIPAPPKLPSTAPKMDVIEDEKPANEAGVGNAEAPAKDFDRIIDSALANVTVADTVAKLEDISKIFKTREIPRQLSLVDMMLDSLGLASYFPTLSEAINKSLESNNYVSTRLEDIISRLRGAISGREVDLKGENVPSKANGVASTLQQQTDKEQARKNMRKEQENAELEAPSKPTPQVEIGEDLAGPKAPVVPPTPRPLG